MSLAGKVIRRGSVRGERWVRHEQHSREGLSKGRLSCNPATTYLLKPDGRSAALWASGRVAYEGVDSRFGDNMKIMDANNFNFGI